MTHLMSLVITYIHPIIKKINVTLDKITKKNMSENNSMCTFLLRLRHRSGAYWFIASIKCRSI